MYEIKGLKISGISCGIKKNKELDLMLAIFDEKVDAIGLFSTSSIVSPVITWNKKILAKNKKIKALIVNSGNANSFTGKDGIKAIKQITMSLAKKLDISQDEILIASTGVIGEKLPYERIINNLDDLILQTQNNNFKNAAEAIMTTDIEPKLVSYQSSIDNVDVKVTAIAKGAGMAAPNLATILSYIFTDANIPKNILKEIFINNIEDSFNSFSIDGDMSTNDMAIIFSTAKADNKLPINIDDPIIEKFKQDLKAMMINICDQIVAGGEGVTKLVKINIIGAESKKSAKNVGFTIANSPLVKTAINGQDPNWGRIIMAVGKSKEKININKLSLSFGTINIVKNGELNPNYKEEEAAKYMEKSKIELFVDLGLKKSNDNNVTITTCDLSKGYIEINADYRS